MKHIMLSIVLVNTVHISSYDGEDIKRNAFRSFSFASSKSHLHEQPPYELPEDLQKKAILYKKNKELLKKPHTKLNSEQLLSLIQGAYLAREWHTLIQACSQAHMNLHRSSQTALCLELSDQEDVIDRYHKIKHQCHTKKCSNMKTIVGTVIATTVVLGMAMRTLQADHTEA